MELLADSHLGPYRIVAPIGAGGMGRVYRARDDRLRRDVAIKVSNERFSDRFEREARAVAALNHANICTIYDVGPDHLVMEIIEGPTLAERIAQGPLPLDEALEIARQMGAALEAAHDKGIVHRDLKPGNIKITPDGVVKVLDFGLAKEFAREDNQATDNPTDSPTAAAAATMAGIILGTAAYMAPEQARGSPVDTRADIWAFGVVLYEMLTGEALFKSATVSDTLSAVLTREPDLGRIPPKARRLLSRCLEKDPRRRLRDIGDARILLEDAAEVPYRLPARRAVVPWVVAAAATAGLLTALFLLLRSQKADHPLTRLEVDLGRDAAPTAVTLLAISSDGRRLVYPVRGPDGRRKLATRLLDEAKVTLLAGTEGGQQPFFSPDGQWIGFFADSELKKISVRGGTAVSLCKTGVPRGAWWGEDDSIIAALDNSSGLSQVSASGGEPRPVTRLEPGEPNHRWPQILPGGRTVLFTAHSTSLNSYENAAIDVQSLETGARKTLWHGGYYGRVYPTSPAGGYLTFVHEGVLFGVPLDLKRLAIEGTPEPLLEDIHSDPTSGACRCDSARTDIFIYQTGAGMRSWLVEWLDSTGKTQPLLSKSTWYYSPRFSPDGRRLALSIDSGAGSDIFIHDLQSGKTSRLTFDGATNSDPVWAPDGKHLVFRGRPRGKWNLWWIRTDGAGSPQPLLNEDTAGGIGDLGANSFSPDGRYFVFAGGNLAGQELRIMKLALDDPDHPRAEKPRPYLESPAHQSRPAISPDGRWISYTSNESGSNEIYVRPFQPLSATTAGKWQVSMGGGGASIWSRNGRELFYLAGDRIMVVEYTGKGGSFNAGEPRLWSAKRLLDVGFTNLDLAPDGRRFAVFPQPESAETEARHVTFLLNFFAQLERRFQPGRQ